VTYEDVGSGPVTGHKSNSLLQFTISGTTSTYTAVHSSQLASLAASGSPLTNQRTPGTLLYCICLERISYLLTYLGPRGLRRYHLLLPFLLLLSVHYCWKQVSFQGTQCSSLPWGKSVLTWTWASAQQWPCSKTHHIMNYTGNSCLKMAKCLKHVAHKQTKTQQTNSVALSLQANYTDWATATCWRNLVKTFADRGVSRSQRGGSSMAINLRFLGWSHWFSFK
jgi:hypothetical protein